jgi:hypothetical protein
MVISEKADSNYLVHMIVGYDGKYRFDVIEVYETGSQNINEQVRREDKKGEGTMMAYMVKTSIVKLKIKMF